MEWIVTLAGIALGSGGLSAIVVAVLNHRWSARKGETAKLDALISAQKVLMIDRVRYLGGKHLEEGYISLEDKETLSEMYSAYKNLGGNGHLKTVMDEVSRLPVHEKGVEK